MARVTTIQPDAEWPAPFIDYILCKPCPICRAPAWHDCDAPNKQAKSERASRQHTPRQDRGNKHRLHDVGEAPWQEDRQPGVAYHSIDYSGRPAT